MLALKSKKSLQHLRAIECVAFVLVEQTSYCLVLVGRRKVCCVCCDTHVALVDSVFVGCVSSLCAQLWFVSQTSVRRRGAA